MQATAPTEVGSSLVVLPLCKQGKIMALNKTVITQHGLTAINAYHRVESVTLVNKNQIDFVVKSYADTEKPAFTAVTYSTAYDIDGENPIKQAYVALKAQVDFADAVDC
jgi:hypothetical protein